MTPATSFAGRKVAVVRAWRLGPRDGAGARGRRRRRSWPGTINEAARESGAQAGDCRSSICERSTRRTLDGAGARPGVPLTHPTPHWS